MPESQILTFVGIAILLTITPGADTLLVMRSVFSRDQRAGLLTSLGICSGLFIHALFSGIGLSVLIVQSATAFYVVKIMGACYLIFLGAKSIWQFYKHTDYKEPGIPSYDRTTRYSFWTAYAEGLITNVLNPKVAVFYLAFLPQFINPGDAVLAKSILLAGIHCVIGLIWLSLFTLFIGKMRRSFSNPRIRGWLECMSGVVLIGLGLRLALEER